MIKIFIILFTICIYLGLFYWIFNNKKENKELDYRILQLEKRVGILERKYKNERKDDKLVMGTNSKS